MLWWGGYGWSPHATIPSPSGPKSCWELGGGALLVPASPGSRYTTHGRVWVRRRSPRTPLSSKKRICGGNYLDGSTGNLSRRVNILSDARG